MVTRAYYSEIDPYAAEWLRRLIAEGILPDGDVDERDIRDVRPSDLAGYAQCHFFAGLGGWPFALRLAGWPDDRRVWTGSCPCQPFSAAGRGDGFADERHLWPHWFHLIGQCRPPVVFGEQVASKDGLEWFDLVSADKEGADFDIGHTDACAAGFGAPHIRQRLWFVASGDVAQPESGGRTTRHEERRGPGATLPPSDPGTLADTRSVRQGGGAGRRGDDAPPSSDPGGARQGSQRLRDDAGTGDDGTPGRMGHHHHQGLPAREREAVVGEGRRGEGRTALQPGGPSGGVADAEGSRQHQQPREHREPGRERQQRQREPHDRSRVGDAPAAGPTNGFWRDADWIFCRDGKWRPVEPGTFPLAHGVSGRVAVARPGEPPRWVSRTGTLRAFGNAIVPQVAQAFIEAYCDARGLAPLRRGNQVFPHQDALDMELIVPAGWRLWHLGQKSDDTWSAQLYNEKATKHGQGGDAFSAYGIASTPQGAVNACLKGPMSDKLFHDNVVNEEGLPLKAVKAAIEARQAMTRLLKTVRL